MIYLFHGTDTEHVRTKAFDWVAAARAKEPNLAYVRLTREELTPAALEDASTAGGLFVKRLLILLDDPFPATRKKEEEGEDEVDLIDTGLDAYLDALASSDNAIVIVAPGLSAPKTKKLLEKTKKDYRFDERVSTKAARGFNGALVNALGARSREKLWVEVNRALRAGDAPEMLHGLLHWKARDLMEKGSRVWTPEESRRLSMRLIALLQNSRRGGLELSLALEHFALSV